MVNSINKGKRFERLVAKILTKKLNAKFLRVPMSGGLSTMQNTDNFKSDIFTEDRRYKDIVIECKMRKEPILIEELFKQPKGGNELADWLEQVKRQAKKEWLLFAKSNNRKILVMSNSGSLILKICDVMLLRGKTDLYLGFL